MGSFVNLFLVGLGTAFQPFPVFAFILFLASKNGLRKSIWFLCGWAGSLIVVIAAVVALSRSHPIQENSQPSTAVLWIKFGIGVVLVLWGTIQYFRRTRAVKEPSWMTKIDELHGWSAMAVGIFLQPWVLVAAGATVVVKERFDHLANILLLIAFVILCSSTYLAMILYTAFRPQASGKRLEAIRGWINSHRSQMQIVICLVIGLWLIGNSLNQLIV